MGGHARRLYWSPGGDGLEPGLEWLMPKGYEGSWLPTLAGADGPTKPTNKTGPVRWNETSSDPQEGVSSGHFAGKQTGPSAAKPTLNRKLFPSLSLMEKAPAPPMTRQAGTFPPTDPCGREEDSQKMGQTLVNAVISEWYQ